MKRIRILTLVSVCMMAWIMPASLIFAYSHEGGYIEPGYDVYCEELEPGGFWEGIYYHGDGENEVYVVAPIRYEEGGYDINGGYYCGDLVIPSEMYGWFEQDEWFTVVGIADMYKNGLTSLYLPETIEWIGHTIESCRYLERVHLNNSLKTLNGIKDCPKLSECPLPLSLEKIGEGWMSGIAISESHLPESLRHVGEGCFCRLPNLREITIPETLESLGKGCFSECYVLERVTLPSSPVIGEYCFCGCPSIKEVSVYAQTPYEFPVDCFKDTDKANCTLCVPVGSGVAYAEADGWNEFGMIVESLESGVNPTLAQDFEWRAFSSQGHIVIDSTSEDTINVYGINGEQVTSVSDKGRTIISPPKGMYIVRSNGKAMKVRI